MPLIDRTYFVGPLHIPQANASGVAENLDLHIQRYEPRYLRAAMGPSMYAAFAAGLAAGSVPYFSEAFSDAFLKSTLAVRWDWLVNGHTFSVNNTPVIWPGLASDESPIAAFVYWQWRKNHFTTTQSTGGETLGSYENATAVSPAQKMVDAWNGMVEQTRALSMILGTTGLYPEFAQRELACNPDSIDVYHYQNTMGL